MGDHETRLRALERLKYLLLGGCLLGGSLPGAAATLIVFALSKHQEDMMTIAMPDSIYPQNLPPGYPAYLGYVDGRWPTAPVLHSKFPGAHIVALTVIGNTLDADGCDIEPQDLSPASGAAWAARKLGAAPASRPVLYASASTMGSVLGELAARRIHRASVRLLSAHYGAGEHICGPATCGLVSVPMDGTQWTNSYPGLNGSRIDMSVLIDGFFGTAGGWAFGEVRGLQVVNAGPHSVKLSWSAPNTFIGTPPQPPPGIASYEIAISEGPGLTTNIPSYPRYKGKGPNPEVWQGGSLQPGTQYTAGVRALAKDGHHSSPWATVTFRTAAG